MARVSAFVLLVTVALLSASIADAFCKSDADCPGSYCVDVGEHFQQYIACSVPVVANVLFVVVFLFFLVAWWCISRVVDIVLQFFVPVCCLMVSQDPTKSPPYTCHSCGVSNAHSGVHCCMPVCPDCDALSTQFSHPLVVIRLHRVSFVLLCIIFRRTIAASLTLTVHRSVELDRTA
jgi:hypothetical protein